MRYLMAVLLFVMSALLLKTCVAVWQADVYRRHLGADVSAWRCLVSPEDAFRDAVLDRLRRPGCPEFEAVNLFPGILLYRPQEARRERPWVEN